MGRIGTVIVVTLILLVPLPALAGGPPHRDPRTALALSLGTTLAGATIATVGEALPEEHGWTPVALVGAALFLVGPTTGHVYAGHPLSGWLGVRAVSLVVTAVGGATAFSCFLQCRPPAWSIAAWFVGDVAFGVATIAEIGTAPDDARRFNRRHAVTITPAPVRGGATLMLTAKW